MGRVGKSGRAGGRCAIVSARLTQEGGSRGCCAAEGYHQIRNAHGFAGKGAASACRPSADVLDDDSGESAVALGYRPLREYFDTPQYYGDPAYSFYYDLGKGKTVVDFSVDCVQRAEKEKWVGMFRKDIGFE